MRRFVLTLGLVAATMIVAMAEDKFFDSGGVNIRYLETGTGQPVVLIHGILGNVEGNWLKTGVVPNLSRDYRVIAYDQRGHGQSGKPHGPQQYGRQMADDVVRLLDHLKISKAHVVGYSLGGTVASLAAVLYPDRFATLTLGGIAPLRGEWTTERRQTLEERAQEFERGVLRSLFTLSAPSNESSPSDEEILTRSKVVLEGKIDRHLPIFDARNPPLLSLMSRSVRYECRSWLLWEATIRA